MKLIVGLGNPGPRYRGTRHNVGFAVLDELARRRHVEFDHGPVDALIAKVRGSTVVAVGDPTAAGDSVVSGDPQASGCSRMGSSSVGNRTGFPGILLAKPLTFMNASGDAVGGLLRYFKIDPADLLVIVDEAQLPLGRLRARARGSAGGHNGLKSVIAHVGEEFSRLRLGVGRGGRQRDLADHVLAKFDADESAEAERMIGRAADAADTFINAGIAAVMNQFNGGDPATSE